MQFSQDGDKLIIALEGRIDTTNADEIQDQITALLEKHNPQQVEFDVAKLGHIASAGLRIIMRVLKQIPQTTIVNAVPEVYEIFDITGIVQMMDVQRALREVSIDGLELIGAGANGHVYRLDEERIIKVYNPITNTPEKILSEREVSRKAFVHGIPSAISFELVRVGKSYGIIYEMIDAHTLGQTINLHPDRLEEYATRMAELLKQLHATEFEEGDLPDARLVLHVWADVAERSGLYPETTIAKMRAAINAIPQGNTFVHGDYHPGNIMVTDADELLLIDMGDASMGDPLIDLCGSCQIMYVMQRNPQAIKHYTSLDLEDVKRVWDIFLRTYCETDNEAQLEAVTQRLEFYGLIRTMAGLSFSDVLTDDMRGEMARQVNGTFLKGYERFVGR